jgi:beta-galactosidase
VDSEQTPADRGVRRRTVLIGTAAGAGALATTALSPLPAGAATAGTRVVYNLNHDWRFVQNDVSGAQAVAFDDRSWTTVSVPHTFNDVDSFDEWITSSGEHHVARQIVWYRKHFTVPADQAGKKVFFECEGIRQAAVVFVNGTRVGLYEGGVTPFGFDITDQVRFGADNVIAVQADNSAGYAEKATGQVYQWDSRDFNPTFGGLTRNVRLVLTPRAYFTLPLYNGLRTTGTYVYGTNYNINGRTVTINAEAQVRNEQTGSRSVTVQVNLINAAGTTVATFSSAAVTLAAGATQVIRAVSARIPGMRFWEPGDPYLYTVETVLLDGTTVTDVQPIRTGFRKVEHKGGAGTGGVWINERQVYLTGYAIRSPNEWPAIGGAVPEWLRDYDGRLIRASNANLIRWMHIAAQPSGIRFTDRHGIVSIQPAGDKEKDTTGRQWEQRVETMRDTMIYFRNSPSILYWEAGNNWITPAHMREMTDLRKVWDPSGGRAMGCRAISDDPAYGGREVIDAAEYVGTMLNRHYSVYARDRMPIIESEYTRDEAPRRVWDDFSPPDFDYVRGPEATWDYTSEQFAGPVAASTRWEFWGQRIMAPGAADGRRYAGSAALIWADSCQHGRQYGCETSRLSGRVDALRLPKESLHTFTVMQSAVPAIHVIGHWSYPAGTRKTIYVMAAHVARVTLFVNDVQAGTSTAPTQDFLHTFPDVAYRAGTVVAVGYDAAGVEVVRQEKATAGPATALRLTARTAPGGLRADGSDVFFADVEVVDARGRRVPTDQARVNFAVTGPGTLLGSYNAGKQHSVHQPYVDTECGINRVFVRAARTAGVITLTATRGGLTAATTSVRSLDFPVLDGLTTTMPDQF